jgi:Ras-related protein Rab-8A
VGKSSLLSRYTDGSFMPDFQSTVGIDFKTKDTNIDNSLWKISIWDSAGSEKFRAVAKSYYRGAQGVLFVYDLTDKESFFAIQSWMQEVELSNNQIVKILVGNKSDEIKDRTVSFDEGQEVADQYNIKYVETSAKGNINVRSAFEALAREVIKGLKDAVNPISPSSQEQTINFKEDRLCDNGLKKSCC